MLNSDTFALAVANRNFISGSNFTAINHLDAVRLSLAAQEDALRVAQVAWVSFSEGVSSASRRRYTWATVKLYYAAFYALRARLLLSDIIILYRNRKPLWVRAKAGESFAKCAGNTHSAAFKIFRDLFPRSPVLAQDIEGVDALEWIEGFRNKASYGQAPIIDPEVPQEFKLFSERPRALLQACTDLTSGMAFDPSGALIAFPFYLISDIDSIIKVRNSSTKIPVEKFFVDILGSEGLFLSDFSTALGAYSFSPSSHTP